MKASAHHLETIGNTSCMLGEGPVWDAAQNVIYWIDILNGIIHRFNIHTKEQQKIILDQMIGSFALAANGKIIAALKDGIYWVDQYSGVKELIVQPERELIQNRFNDGKCDPAGRFWAGTMSLQEEKGAGNLYMFAKDSTRQKIECQKQISDLTISNGMVWDEDCATFYFIDTPTCEVVAYDYESITGSITNKRVVLKFHQDDGYPDGMTIDSEGMLWIAHWDGWQISRWNPATGKKLESIELPVARVTSCTFGGPHLTDLFITTASVGLSDADLAKQPLAGSLFRIINCGCKGRPTHLFSQF